MSENCIVVKESVFVKAIRYKKIDLTDPQPETWYERKVLGWTAPISNDIGYKLAEKRDRANKLRKIIRVRKL